MNIIPYSQFNKPLFHVSFSLFNEFTIEPKLYLDKNVSGDVSNMKRVSVVYGNPLKALPAIGTLDIAEQARIRGDKYITLYVYQPDINSNDKIITDKELMKHKAIFDIALTNEIWLITLRPYTMKLINRINIPTNLSNRKIITYPIYNNKNEMSEQVVFKKSFCYKITNKVLGRPPKYNPNTGFYADNINDNPVYRKVPKKWFNNKELYIITSPGILNIKKGEDIQNGLLYTTIISDIKESLDEIKSFLTSKIGLNHLEVKRIFKEDPLLLNIYKISNYDIRTIEEVNKNSIYRHIVDIRYNNINTIEHIGYLEIDKNPFKRRYKQKYGLMVNVKPYVK